MQLMKRNLSIRDDSSSSVEVTLWGHFSSDPGDQLEEVTPAYLAITQALAVYEDWQQEI
jgi:hypothetical protein